MNENLEIELKKLEKDFIQEEKVFQEELSKIQAGTANISLLSNLIINYNDQKHQLRSIATINVLNNQSVLIKPFDLKAIKKIENSIKTSHLTINTQIENNLIYLSFPNLTTENKNNLVKIINEKFQQKIIYLKNLRHKFLKKIKQDKKSFEIIKNYDEKSIDFYKKNVDKLILIKDKKIEQIYKV
jgi:ribosome recycling factor